MEFVGGILVEPRNHRQLAEAVISLLHNEAERGPSGGRNGECIRGYHFQGNAKLTFNRVEGGSLPGDA